MNYTEIHLTKKEYLKILARGTTYAFFVLYLFYHNVILVLILSVPFNLIYLKKVKKDRITFRIQRLNMDFKECMIALSTALGAGYSMENAFEIAKKDLELLYDEDADIMVELRNIITQVRMNRNVEELIMDFAVRSGAEDIMSFAEVFVTAKRTGGNLIKIMRRTSDNLNQKMEVKREIDTVITAKKLESKIMSVIPIAMILYLSFFSPGYLYPLYHNLFGMLFMTVALALYMFAFFLMEKIMNIDF